MRPTLVLIVIIVSLGLPINGLPTKNKLISQKITEEAGIDTQKSNPKEEADIDTPTDSTKKCVQHEIVSNFGHFFITKFVGKYRLISHFFGGAVNSRLFFYQFRRRKIRFHKFF